MVGIVVSVDEANGMGKDNKLLFHDPRDMALFQQNTKGGVVLMGRSTWESLPKKPLSNRTNVVVTSNPPDETFENTYFISILEADTLVRQCRTILKNTDLYIIGGEKLIKRYRGSIDFMYISHFKGVKQADTFLPIIHMAHFDKTFEMEYDKFTYCEYVKKDKDFENKIKEIVEKYFKEDGE